MSESRNLCESGLSLLQQTTLASYMVESPCINILQYNTPYIRLEAWQFFASFLVFLQQVGIGTSRNTVTDDTPG